MIILSQPELETGFSGIKINEQKQILNGDQYHTYIRHRVLQINDKFTQTNANSTYTTKPNIYCFFSVGVWSEGKTSLKD